MNRRCALIAMGVSGLWLMPVPYNDTQAAPLEPNRNTVAAAHDGISPTSPEKKPSLPHKPEITPSPHSNIPAAKDPKEHTPCVGMGCGNDQPACVGMGCGQTEPGCVGMGCKPKGAGTPNGGSPAGEANLPTVKPTVFGAAPCCGIAAIAGNGLVTAQDRATGKTFQFQAGQTLKTTLRVGQHIYADFGTQQVSVDGLAPCCSIVSSQAGQPNIPAAKKPTVLSATPCCSIAAIAENGLITAHDRATGKTFQFQAGQTIRTTLRVGQYIYADFGTQQVSVDGLAPCCSIVSSQAGQPNIPAAKKPTVLSATPCCGIAAIAENGLITAHDRATGRTFQFQASQTIRNSLRVGQQIYADFGTQQVSMDGLAPCCSIVSSPATSQSSLPTVKKPTVFGATPCCAITAITDNGFITAQDRATGKTFQFQASQTIKNTLRVGKTVYADFGAQQVSVDGAAPCCNITSALPIP